MGIAALLFFTALNCDNSELWGVNARYFIMVPLLCGLVFLINPLDMNHRAARIFILQLLLQVICSPFAPARFVQSYVGDVLTSLVHPMADIEYTVCFYASGE